MDVLTDILGSLRLTGGVVVDAEAAGDFCFLSQFTEADCKEMLPGYEGHLIAYHYVRKGRIFASIGNHQPVEAVEGDIILVPRNDQHLVFSDSRAKPIDSHSLLDTSNDGPARIVVKGDGPPAEFYCGFLGMMGDDHPLLDSLPPILKLDGGNEAQEEWLESSMRMLNEGHHSPEIVARLAELFLTEAIRRYVDDMPAGEGGWLAGLRDPAVARALGIIHSRYAEELEVEQLAREAGVSRSILGERFVKLLGEPPMKYCARWRMRVAANMLRDGKDNTANIAYAVGFNSEAAFNRAFKREYGEPPATWRRRLEDARERESDRRGRLPDQEVRYCAAHDGTRLAWSIVGEGPPLVKTANWLNHLEHDWSSPLWRHWMAELLEGHSLVRYDERGNGMSDWNPKEISFEAFVDDLESVVDCAGLDRFDLLGVSQGAAVAIAYAVRHPERVRKLILYGGYAMGWSHRGNPEERARREAMVTLTEAGWGSDNPAYRQLFTNLYIPGASPAQQSWFTEVQRLSASPENAVKLQRVLGDIDVRDLLEQVKVPTLVAHAKDDQVVPFGAGETMTAKIPGAQFLALEGQNHILLDNEPAWPIFTKSMREFLRGGSLPASPAAARPEAEDRIRTCLADDGTQLAYGDCGTGFPIVKATNWMTHVEMDWTNPVYRHWAESSSLIGRYIRTDMRGFGKSDWDIPSFTFDDLVSDLERVVDDAGVEQHDLFGISHGAAIAMAYAARRPERVRKLVLVNSFACGWRVRADPDEIAWRESLIELNRAKWAKRRSALGEMFIALYFPKAGPELIDWHNRHLGELSNQRNIELMLHLAGEIDVRSVLSKIQAPTLVFHSRDDPGVLMSVGKEVADGIAGARFVELDSANHVLLEDEPAWPIYLAQVHDFLRG